MIDWDISNSDIAHIIDEYIHSERDRKIMKRRIIDDIFFEPLAEEFGLSVRRIKSIVAKEYAIIAKHIND